jgi:hypothetical protein
MAAALELARAVLFVEPDHAYSLSCGSTATRATTRRLATVRRPSRSS